MATRFLVQRIFLLLPSGASLSNWRTHFNASEATSVPFFRRQLSLRFFQLRLRNFRLFIDYSQISPSRGLRTSVLNFRDLWIFLDATQRAPLQNISACHSTALVSNFSRNLLGQEMRAFILSALFVLRLIRKCTRVLIATLRHYRINFDRAC